MRHLILSEILVNGHTYESDTCVMDARATNHNCNGHTYESDNHICKALCWGTSKWWNSMVTHIESIRYFNEIEFEINNLMWEFLKSG